MSFTIHTVTWEYSKHPLRWILAPVAVVYFLIVRQGSCVIVIKSWSVRFTYFSASASASELQSRRHGGVTGSMMSQSGCNEVPVSVHQARSALLIYWNLHFLGTLFWKAPAPSDGPNQKHSRISSQYQPRSLVFVDDRPHPCVTSSCMTQRLRQTRRLYDNSPHHSFNGRTDVSRRHLFRHSSNFLSSDTSYSLFAISGSSPCRIMSAQLSLGFCSDAASSSSKELRPSSTS